MIDDGNVDDDDDDDDDDHDDDDSDDEYLRQVFVVVAGDVQCRQSDTTRTHLFSSP